VDVWDFINYRLKAGELVARLNQAEKWGMKHPSLLNRWKELAPYIPDPRFVVTHRRDFDAQYQSHRGAIRIQTYDEVVERTARYYLELDQVTMGRPRIDVHYEDWFDPSLGQLEKLAEFVGLPPNEEARNLIDPSLKHF